MMKIALLVALIVAALISVPIQYNYDENIGPVIPIELNANWNLISRTILPLVSQHDIFPGAGSQSGTGDIVASAFFSPKRPTAGGQLVSLGGGSHDVGIRLIVTLLFPK